MANKLGRKLTFSEGLILIKLHDPLITCLAGTRDKLKMLNLRYHNV